MLFGLVCTGLKAQVTPMKSQFFQNPYLVDPAMAGYSGKTSVFMNYSSQLNRINGGPVLMSLSASTPLGDKASVGLNIINDKAGLLSKTQAMVGFSYKVPFTEEQSLRFGVSLAWAQEKVDYSQASSSGSIDPELGKNNNQESYLDGNFGVAYIYSRFEAQFSYLNLNQKRIGEFSTVDYSTFYSSISYRFQIDNEFSVKPLIAYRGLKNVKNQYDIAAEWRAKDLIFYTMYHSNKTFTGGVGIDFKKKIHISGLYNTEPSALRGFSGGIFDAVLGINF